MNQRVRQGDEVYMLARERGYGRDLRFSTYPGKMMCSLCCKRRVGGCHITLPGEPLFHRVCKQCILAMASTLESDA